jgi:hypothetical protein
MQVRADIFVNKAYEEWMHDVGYDGKAHQRFKHNLSEPEVIQQQLQQVTMLHMVRSIHINNYRGLEINFCCSYSTYNHISEFT